MHVIVVVIVVMQDLFLCPDILHMMLKCFFLLDHLFLSNLADQALFSVIVKQWLLLRLILVMDLFELRKLKFHWRMTGLCLTLPGLPGWKKLPGLPLKHQSALKEKPKRGVQRSAKK
jgi:hypothetical protein